MPRKNKMRRPHKAGRRRVPRRKGRVARATTVNRSINLISPRYITRLKYSDTYALSVLSLGINQQEWRMNSCFDPDLSGVGHQPMGFDQLAALYNRYRVFAFSWKIIAASASAAQDCFVIPMNSGTNPFASWSNAAEFPRAIAKTTAPTGPAIRFFGRMYLPNLSGVTPTQYKTDDRFQAQNGANPLENMTLQFGAVNQSGVTAAIYLTVVLVYHVEWFDPIQPAQS